MEEANGGAMAAAMAARSAPADAVRAAELAEAIRSGRGDVEPVKRLCPCGCLEALGSCSNKKGPPTLASPAEPPDRPAPSVKPTCTTPPARTAPVTTEKPAEPAKEEPMPKGVRSGGPCKGCGTKSTRCKADCPERGGKATPAARPAAVEKLRPARAPRREPVEDMLGLADHELDEAAVEVLVAARDRLEAALERKANRAEEEARAARAALVERSQRTSAAA